MLFSLGESWGGRDWGKATENYFSWYVLFTEMQLYWGLRAIQIGIGNATNYSFGFYLISVLISLLLPENMDAMVEASRVFGNFSRSKKVRAVLAEHKGKLNSHFVLSYWVPLLLGSRKRNVDKWKKNSMSLQHWHCCGEILEVREGLM